MIRIEYQLTAVIFLLSICQIYGSCFVDTPLTSSNGDSTVKYCQYSGANYTVNSTWTIGYPDCMSCQCTEDIMQCCGYGINAGQIELQENCQLREGTCDVIVVQSNNPEKLCDEDNISTTKAMRLFRKIKVQIKRIFSKIIN